MTLDSKTFFTNLRYYRQQYNSLVFSNFLLVNVPSFLHSAPRNSRADVAEIEIAHARQTIDRVAARNYSSRCASLIFI